MQFMVIRFYIPQALLRKCGSSEGWIINQLTDWSPTQQPLGWKEPQTFYLAVN